jgi:hypothetical protein
MEKEHAILEADTQVLKILDGLVEKQALILTKRCIACWCRRFLF